MSIAENGELITPVILAGGSGTRLWPLSSDDKPKQFQQIAGRSSMFQQTLSRVSDPNRFTAPVIIGNAGHAELIEAELADCKVEPAAIVLEPEGRNTAPAVALSALLTLACKLSDYVLIMPSDHYIRDPGELIGAIDQARSAAASGSFVTFGIEPDGPETCYGYIRKGEAVTCKQTNGDEIFKVAKFVEKPPRHTAVNMLKDGGYFWNSGMFLFPVQPLLKEFMALKPEMVEACQSALMDGELDGKVVRPCAEAFKSAENISIDYAVMEQTSRAAVIPVDPLWNDVGSWTAVWQISKRDSAQNVTVGDVMLHDVQGAYVRSEGPVTAVVGLEDVIVVNTGEAVIVAAKSHAQDIREIAEAVRSRKQGRVDGQALAQTDDLTRSIEEVARTVPAGKAA